MNLLHTMKRALIFFILFFGISATASASSIHAFRTDVDWVFSTSGVAEDMATDLRRKHRIGAGDIVYIRVHQNRGNKSFYLYVGS